MVNHSLKGLDLFGQSERRYHQKECCSQLGAVGTNDNDVIIFWIYD